MNPAESGCSNSSQGLVVFPSVDLPSSWAAMGIQGFLHQESREGHDAPSFSYLFQSPLSASIQELRTVE